MSLRPGRDALLFDDIDLLQAFFGPGIVVMIPGIVVLRLQDRTEAHDLFDRSGILRLVDRDETLSLENRRGKLRLAARSEELLPQ